MPFKSGVTLEKYTSNVSGYTAKLNAYNAEMVAYEADGAKDTGKFALLQSQFASLESEKKTLDIERNIISAPVSQTMGLIDQPGPTAFSVNLQILSANVARTGDFGQLYKDFEFAIAANTTHILPNATGFGKWVDVQQATSPSPVGSVVAGVAYGAEAIYTDIRENPIQDLALLALPGAFKYGEWAISSGVASAARSSVPIVKTGGRLLSTPLATDLGKYVIKGALVVPWVYESARSVIDAPMTPEGKGTAFGHVGYQVGMMGIGEATIARNMIMTAPDNPIAGTTFFRGIRKQGPITSAVDESIILAARGELRLRGMKDEAGILKDTWTITKLGRYITPEQKGGDVFEGVTGVPQEHIPIIGEATKGGGFFGASTARSQVGPEARFEDPRLWEIRTRQSKEFRNAESMSEKFDMLDAAKPDITTPVQGGPRVQPDYPISLTSDVDVFKTPELVKATLMSDPGSFVGFRTPDVIIKSPHPDYPGITVETILPGQIRYTTGAKGLAEIKAGEIIEPFSWGKAWAETKATFTGEKPQKSVTWGDVTGIYARGKLIEVDPHTPPDWYPKLAYETGPRTSGGYPEPNARQPLIFRIFGNPMARGPVTSDIWLSKTGDSKEKLGYTLQRSGASVSDLVGLRENAGGYRVEKDFYRFVSQGQNLRTVEAGRLALGKTPGKGTTLSGKQVGKMSAAIDSLLGRDIRYQTTKGSDVATTRIRDMMEIGVERMNVGLTLRGEPLGPYETGIGLGQETKPGEPMSSRDLAEAFIVKRSGESPGYVKAWNDARIESAKKMPSMTQKRDAMRLQMDKMAVEEPAPEFTRLYRAENEIPGGIKLGIDKGLEPVKPEWTTKLEDASTLVFGGKKQADVVTFIDVPVGDVPLYSKQTGTGGIEYILPEKVASGRDIWYHDRPFVRTQIETRVTSEGQPGRRSPVDIPYQKKSSASQAAEWLAKNSGTTVPVVERPLTKVEIKPSFKPDTRDILPKTTEPLYDRTIRIGSPGGTPKPLLVAVAPITLSSFKTQREDATSRNAEPPHMAAKSVIPPTKTPVYNTGGGVVRFTSTPATPGKVASAVAVPAIASVVANAMRQPSTPRTPEKPKYEIVETPEKPPYITPGKSPKLPYAPDKPEYPLPGKPTVPSAPAPGRTPTPSTPEKPQPPYEPPYQPDTPVPPPLLGGGTPFGGGGGSSYEQQPSERLWTFTNPVGADRLTREAGRKFKPMNMKIKKFKMPRF
jgi:hypothetical protein